MIINFSDFLVAISATLDFVEMDLVGVTTNHSRRVGYIALSIAKELGLPMKEQIDAVSLSILHDNGLTELMLNHKLRFDNPHDLVNERKFIEHCVIGEKNIKNFPLLSLTKNAIKFHHENYDGSGFFGLSGSETPLMAQIISFADHMDFMFKYQSPDYNKIDDTNLYVRKQRKKRFSPDMVDAFLKISENNKFWESLSHENIENALYNDIPHFRQNLKLKDISKAANVFSDIIDSKSHFTRRHSTGLAQKVSIATHRYNFSNDERIKMIIAAKLHDIGKLAVPNSILDKDGKLTKEEIKIVQKHTYLTRKCLEKIVGFEEIVEWASNHHEKLNGSGYPLGLKADELDFNSRLMACLDIYQALTEDRPYRKPMPHSNAMQILRSMAESNFIDANIVEDIDAMFG